MVERTEIPVRREDGSETFVVKLQRFRTYQPLSGPASRSPGLIEYFDARGEHVNQLSEDEFEVVVTEERLRRIK